METLTVALMGIGKADDGSFTVPSSIQNVISQFEEAHQNVQIEVTGYQRGSEVFGVEYEDEITLLQREIISGKGPDVIIFIGGYYMSDISGKYMENLYAYLGEDWEDRYVANVVNAYSYDGGLYAIPVSFTLKTLVVAARTAQGRESWTMEELIAAYEEAYEASGGTVMLLNGDYKKNTFTTLLYNSAGDFVDWESGACSFDSEEFRKLLEFSDSFPESYVYSEDFHMMEEYAAGNILLYPLSLSDVYEIAKAKMIFGEDVTFIGYPSNDGGGAVVSNGNLSLAISALSEQKEAAWEFISLFLGEEYQRELANFLPVNKVVLYEKLEEALTTVYEEDTNGNQTPVAQDKVSSEGEGVIAEIYQISEDEKEAFLGIIESVSESSAFDLELYSLILDETQGYFEGEKTVEETMEVIQGIATVYVNENIE